jgi:hypothetical protein
MGPSNLLSPLTQHKKHDNHDNPPPTIMPSLITPPTDVQWPANLL